MGNHRPITARRHDDGVDRWEMAYALPAARLSPWIDRYCSYSERTASFTARRELAGTAGVLLYALGDPLELVGADGRAIVIRAGEAFVAGIADATSISRGPGSQAGVHVSLPLESLAAVTGAPVAEIANRVVPLADMIGAPARDLGHALGEAEDAHARFDLLDDFLLGRLAAARGNVVDHPVSWAMARLAAPGGPGVAALAEEIGWSRKHLAARFRASIGLGPQAYRRLSRFERFAAAIAVSPAKGLAELALDAGYHDQPHMTREVRAFAAMSPGELRARLIPAQGGVRDDEVANVQEAPIPLL